MPEREEALTFGIVGSAPHRSLVDALLRPFAELVRSGERTPPARDLVEPPPRAS